MRSVAHPPPSQLKAAVTVLHQGPGRIAHAGMSPPSMRESMQVVVRILMEDDDATEDQLDYKSVGDALLIGV